MRILIMSAVVMVSSCGSENQMTQLNQQSSSVLSTTPTQAPVQKDELIDLGRQSLGIAQQIWDRIPVRSLEDVRQIACTGSLGHTLKDISSLEISTSIDPLKRFPGIGSIAGLPAQLSYVFSRQADGQLSGRAYVAPGIKVGRTKNPTELRLGWSWGCQEQMQRRGQWFAHTGVAGVSAHFGVDGISLLSTQLFDGKGTQPINYSQVKEQFLKPAEDLLNQTRQVALGGANSKRYSSFNPFYKAATPDTIRAALKDAESMKFAETTYVNTTEVATMGALVSGQIQGALLQQRQTLDHEVQDFFDEYTNFLKSTPAEGKLQKLVQNVISERLYSTYLSLEEELHTLAQVYGPIFVFSRSRSIDQKTLTDRKQQFLDQIKKKHGYYTSLWMSDVLDAFELRFKGLQALRQLAQNWHSQMQGEGMARADHTVGGFHNGPIFHGCNYVAMTPQGIANYRRVVTSPASVPAALLNPFKLISTVIKLPFKTFATITNFKESIFKAARGLGTSLNESTVGINYAYEVPGSEWNPSQSAIWGATGTANAASKAIKAVEEFFSWGCGPAAATPQD